MGKLNDLVTAVRALHECAAALATAADLLQEAVEANKEKLAVQAVVEEGDLPEEKPVSLEQLRGVLVEKSMHGCRAEVQDLIRKYGAERLSDIDPKHYSAMLSEAEVM